MQPDEEKDFDRWFDNLVKTAPYQYRERLTAVKEYINAAFSCGFEWGYYKRAVAVDQDVYVQQLIALDTDHESECHQAADNILKEAMRAAGLHKIVDVYYELEEHFWYS